MNRRVLGSILVWLVTAALFASFAQAATIVGSLHDLSHTMKNSSMAFWDTYADYDQVCVYCHTPHNSLPGEQLLWNRSLPTGPYSLYGSESLISGPEQPANHSLMCLSCHDGTIAVDAVLRTPINTPDGERTPFWSNPSYPGYEPYHGKMANDTQSSNQFWDCGVACHSADPIWAPDYSGTFLTQDLSNDHPVSVTYPDPGSYPDRFETPPASGRWPNGVQLYSNKVECGSCHDVHNPDHKPFLRCSNDGSALCFTCHNK